MTRVGILLALVELVVASRGWIICSRAGRSSPGRVRMVPGAGMAWAQAALHWRGVTADQRMVKRPRAVRRSRKALVVRPLPSPGRGGRS